MTARAVLTATSPNRPGATIGGALRPAVPADAAAIHALIARYQAAGRLLPRPEDEIARHADRFLVITDGAAVVGCAELAPLSAAVAEVRSLVVDEQARGLGFGRVLVERHRRRSARRRLPIRLRLHARAGVLRPAGLLAGAARVAAREDRARLRWLHPLPRLRAGGGPAAARGARAGALRMSVTEMLGGITAADGFRASAVAAGIKASGALDVTLIVADAPASVAAVFTTNQVQAAPVQVSRAHVRASGGTARAVIVNSGCANACTGPQGLATTQATAAAVAGLVQCPVEQVLVSSTGVIGVHLPADKIIAAPRPPLRRSGGTGMRRRAAS